MPELLRTVGLTKCFRGLVANDSIDFTLEAGALRCVIGPNGAGKTTLISLISGHQEPSGGTIWFQGRNITRLSIIERARRGILRKFQTPTLFDNLSAYDNVELGVLRTDCPPRKRHQRVLEVLDLIRLAELADTPASSLSHGQRQWLEVGLLLANNAILLLLDEPTAGMTVEETAATGQLIRRLGQDLGLSAIIIEHDINFIRDLEAPVTVLHLGKVLLEGPFHDIEHDEQVRNVYLGDQ